MIKFIKSLFVGLMEGIIESKRERAKRIGYY